MSGPVDSVSEPELPELGVGITYSSAIAPLLDRDADLVDVIEIEPQTTWLETRSGVEPYRVIDQVVKYIAELPVRKIVHSIGAPVGGSVPPDRAQLTLLQQTIHQLDAPWLSEHLSFNATPDFRTGFFLPPRQTLEGVETAVAAIRHLRQTLQVPIAVETGVNYLHPRQDEIPDGAFVAAVVENADCGLLLDLHNIYANAINGRQSVNDFVAEIPLERVWEVHLAGGFEMDGYWLDAHSGAIPDPLFVQAQRIVAAMPNLKAIIFEIFPVFVPIAGFDVIRAQLERLHDLWSRRGRVLRRRPPTLSDDRQDAQRRRGQAPPNAWECALGSLVVGREPEDALSRELAADPGVALVNRLAREFRASMIVNVLRRTSRLMMLALGQDVFRAILTDYWAKVPPQMFACSEAKAFAEYLEALDLKVPQFAEVLEFERAVLATLIDDQPRVVVFEFDPLPMLLALAEGHLPDKPSNAGHFEIEITPDSHMTTSGMNLETIRESFPHH